MLTALTILLIRQYRLAGSREEFFKWLFQKIRIHSLRAVRIGVAFFLIAASLKA